MKKEATTVDLLVVGGGLAGLSVAIEAKEAGVDNILVVEPGDRVAAPEVVGSHALSVEFLAPFSSITATANDLVVAEGERLAVSARVVVVAIWPERPSAEPGLKIADSLDGRVHVLPPAIDLRGRDVLVVGTDEVAAEYAWELGSAGVSIVLAFCGANPEVLSRLARRYLLRLEAERKATILWQSRPAAIEDVAGFPMVYFGDRRTPDLQFDHVIFRYPAAYDETPFAEKAVSPGNGMTRIYQIGHDATDAPRLGGKVVEPGYAWETLRIDHWPHLPAASGRPSSWRQGDEGPIKELRRANYNATITFFERSHSDLWVLRVEPDHGDTHHLAGQYASLGLGYWEPRADSALDPGLERSWSKLIRRSYSISSPIFDDAGYLFDAFRSHKLEFYIVLVPPAVGRVPALTPRLALKRPGDRVYLGPKVAGRYTLTGVIDPHRRLALLATGTGEAPHNSMVVELLRKGHRGPILSVVCVRQETDLGYREVHRRLEEQYSNYRYLTLITRDPRHPRLYIQDALGNGLLEERLGEALDPAITDVYLCGNPAMIGLPEYGEDGEARFPEQVGVCQLLVERGFTIERRGVKGNVHYEEYW
ncbi:MAG: FAD-binding protein [Actinomycetota bacterium]